MAKNAKCKSEVRILDEYSNTTQKKVADEDNVGGQFRVCYASELPIPFTVISYQSPNL